MAMACLLLEGHAKAQPRAVVESAGRAGGDGHLVFVDNLIVGEMPPLPCQRPVQGEEQRGPGKDIAPAVGVKPGLGPPQVPCDGQAPLQAAHGLRIGDVRNRCGGIADQICRFELQPWPPAGVGKVDANGKLVNKAPFHEHGHVA